MTLKIRWLAAVWLVACAPAWAQVQGQGQGQSPGALSRAHAALGGAANCSSCHQGAGGTPIADDKCLTCHRPIADRMRAKRGVHREVTGACASCHTEHQGVDTDLRPLDPASFDHAAETGFALTGRHAGVSTTCTACHKTRSYLGNTPSCSSCHTEPHQGAMGQPCATCHTPSGWRVVSRAFHKSGVFPLEGRHLEVACASCHIAGVVKGTPTRCADCHWVRRQDDPYRTRLGSDCGQCHRPVGWTAVKWDHRAMTGTALSPAHRSLGCEGCHTSRTFQSGSVSCAACHASAYQATRSPAHAPAGFPMQCDLCHKPSQTSWNQAQFAHASYFTLTGPHATQACAACHKNNVYKGTPRDCVGCHRTNYDRAANPNHAAAGFPTTCESCHRASDSTWRSTFNHGAIFPLAGVHTTQACSACHKNNVYKGTPRDCVGCHRANYDRTTSPNHAAAGFPTACESCHRASDSTWRTTFNHSAAYPLVGVHATQACTACHKNNVYRGTPRDCVGCHRTDYERTTKPAHASAGFPTTCDSCHSASSSTWTASFDHNRFFVLAGRHLSAACSSCHTGNVYRGTPRECVACHLAKYNQTTNPNHRAAGFPTTCDVCHRFSDSSWNQGRFTHTWFPITSGRHAGRPCSACHLDPNNYRSFSCLTCHDRTKMDSEHRSRPGYRYDSAACYSCHPNGQGD